MHHRFESLLRHACIELADLPHEVELNGLMMYDGLFPHGAGRLLLHPSIPIGENPRFVAVVAHEIAHLLLHRFADHPASVIDFLLDPTQRALYHRYEAEADRLAAHLLVPPTAQMACRQRRYPTLTSAARQLGVPAPVVARALASADYDPAPIPQFLTTLIGRADFLPQRLARAA